MRPSIYVHWTFWNLLFRRLGCPSDMIDILAFAHLNSEKLIFSKGSHFILNLPYLEDQNQVWRNYVLQIQADNLYLLIPSWRPLFPRGRETPQIPPAWWWWVILPSFSSCAQALGMWMTERTWRASMLSPREHSISLGRVTSSIPHLKPLNSIILSSESVPLGVQSIDGKTEVVRNLTSMSSSE